MKTTTNNKRFNAKMIGITLGVFVAIGGSMLTAPGTTHAATTSKTTTTTATVSKEAATGTSLVDNIIATGEQYLGVQYKFGAKSGITSAFDCSSFMQYIFKENGIDLPRSSRQQALVGTPVKKADLQPGDLVFTDTNKDGKINHVSLYIGNGKLLQTYRVGVGVTISDFKGSVWDRTFVTARHVLSGDSETDTDNGSDGNVGGDTGSDTDTGTDSGTDNEVTSTTDQVKSGATDNDGYHTDKPYYRNNR
ncbi:C40 family peptidase [Paenibacillus sp. OV219]|uniref:C40 family peptidase n=1 Tax=Paenibacillus sp. OV219 TaxID=1884377 RepID=UPI0008BDBF30|nr:C40 family peptidase [Paenibacillus sp. OV219]SEO32823.1 Cell wall-associated hydrolase, NlpC family [Paenibacillus sp. OV219]